MKEAIEELKQEEAKYRKIYEEGTKKMFVLDGLNADAFNMAISRIEKDGIKETYLFLKSKRDEYLLSYSPLSRNLANAYQLVMGKLWKYYKRV